MLILVIIAVVSLILGTLFLVNEKMLEKMTEVMNRAVVVSKPVGAKTKKILGVFLIIFACVLFVIASKLR